MLVCFIKSHWNTFKIVVKLPNSMETWQGHVCVLQGAVCTVNVTGYWTNYVEQSVTGGLCSSKKNSGVQLFHPSVKFQRPAGRCECVAPFLSFFFFFLQVLWMYIFVCMNVWTLISSTSCVTFCFLHFCIYSNHRCFAHLRFQQFLFSLLLFVSFCQKLLSLLIYYYYFCFSKWLFFLIAVFF